MNCQRALEILSGLAAGQPAFTADEIEELLARGLATEADPRDLATLSWLVAVVQEHAGCTISDPLAAANLAGKLAEIDKQLKSDWYRFHTAKDKLAEREQDRRLVRRALAVLSDQPERERLWKLVAEQRASGDPKYAACEPLGSEVYAITRKGSWVAHDLQARIARFAALPLATFLQQFEKAERKMAAFGSEIATLSAGIGHVAKNPHQVVIGLAKTGAPAADATRLYHQSMRATGAPDVAVTCARNAASFGDPHQVAQRLAAAEHALHRVGCARTPVVAGAAKSLLPFEPLEAGAARFVAIARLLEARNLTRGDATIKCTARLMPAAGEPDELVGRAVAAFAQLGTFLSDREVCASAAVALAAMVQTADAVGPAVHRLIDLQRELVRARISQGSFAILDALECVACPGTPAEVVATVRSLIAQLAAHRAPQRGDVAVAVAFAKRFAY
ncbi:MAG: hypothetical protein E6J91_13950 [Deltaproteobacteria bacterium]|nr:MAG: hypothetical protein E6J91_13950 [Deltaproteobacteria bacterium]